MRRRGFIGMGLALVLAGGCELIGGTEDLYIDEGFNTQGNGLGGGGQGGVAAEGGASPGGRGGEGGDQELCVREECEGEDGECRRRECISNACDFINVTTLTPCSTGYCDGIGNCVECIDNEQTPCHDGYVCQSFACYPPGCMDTMQNNGETAVDCGGPNCGPCPNGATCNVPTDCQSYLCIGEVCSPCAADGDCPGNRYCEGTLCHPDRDDWDNCARPEQCSSSCCEFTLCTPFC
jgi:hypothetical protein